MADEQTGWVLVLTEKQVKQLEALMGECDAHDEWRTPRRIIGDVLQVLLESVSKAQPD